MKDRYYELEIVGLKRKLKKIKLNGISIASFVMLGDTVLIEKTADALYEKMPAGLEMLVCPEAKGIPLTHVLANKIGIDYIILRKSLKGYMEKPLIEKVQSITTREPQIIILDGSDVKKIRGKKVAIVDDVVSTGGSLKAVESLLRRVDCQIRAKVAVLLEEGGYQGKDLIYLKKLPIFKNND
jgi:adenine phosphoribosyltransferase